MIIDTDKVDHIEIITTPGRNKVQICKLDDKDRTKTITIKDKTGKKIDIEFHLR